MEFRKDINGLRAIAVLAVVFFHYEFPWADGGFVGVDVFFVISGYLMTGIIFSKLAKGNFSLIGFYLDRARRIIPALAVLCLAVLVVGWFLLLPSEYGVLGKHVASSVGFLSNIVFWREAGYFDVASKQKWLLHTWSLSVEWQFYLLYPLVILFLRRLLSEPVVRWTLAAAACLSFAFSIYLSSPGAWPTAAFYLLPTRAWEMLAGALVYLFPISMGKRQAFATELTGLALIGISVIGFDARQVWPGWLAMVPVTGAALVILSGRGASALTGNRPAQFIGRTSYSIYLWHWPLVVALGYFEKLDDPFWSAAGIVASFVLGWLSFSLVESRTRGLRLHGVRPAGISHRPALLRFGFAVTGVGLLGVVVSAAQGMPGRFRESVVVADRESGNRNPNMTKCHMLFDPCDVKNRQKASQAVIIGDSHAEAIASALMTAIPEGRGRDVLLIAMHGCPTIYGTRRSDVPGKCVEMNRKFLDTLSADPAASSPVIIANNWSSYLFKKSGPSISFVDGPAQAETQFTFEEFRKRYLSTVCRLSATRPVYVVKPIPIFDVNLPRALALKMMRDPHSPDMTTSLVEYNRKNKPLLDVMDEASRVCGVRLLDPVPHLCRDNQCMGSLNGRPLYSDNNHLSEYGNRFLVPMFRQVFADPNTPF